MTELKGARVVVAGGGALGLAAAICARQAGAEVVLYEPNPIGTGASGVAAGMLAPAMESALDPLSAGHFPLLRAAREMWPEFLDRLGAPSMLLDRSGAMLVAATDEGAVQAAFDQLVRNGSQATRLTGAEARRLQPQLAPAVAAAVLTDEDWRLDPRVLLQIMAKVFLRDGGRIERATLTPTPGGGLHAGGATVAADAVVLAVGADDRVWRSLAPELGWLQPIKGQVLHFEAPPVDGPVVRDALGYVAPQAGGVVAGASMEAGRRDATPDAAVLAALREAAAGLYPHLAEAPARGLAGIRASTPDGLPLVGPIAAQGGVGPRVILACGARRNGWLLAPMVAALAVAHLVGRPDAAGLEAMATQRFGE